MNLSAHRTAGVASTSSSQTNAPSLDRSYRHRSFGSDFRQSSQHARHRSHGRAVLVANTMTPDRTYNMRAKTDQRELDSLRRSFEGHVLDRPSYTERSKPSLQQANDCPCDTDLDDYHPSTGWKWQPHHLQKKAMFDKVREEAREDAAAEPAMASLHSTVVAHRSFERMLAYLLASKLHCPTFQGAQLVEMLQDLYFEEPELADGACADLNAVFDRDPACEKYLHALLYFKGFHAVQCHRVAHHLWKEGRRNLAFAIQSRVSEVFHVDIHPGAQFGRGILMDHATGVVIGETAVLGDNVSMLHHVTLGGSGTGRGIRHPTLGHGVLLGAGVSVLGPIMIGAGSKVGAGSVVVDDMPCHCVAVGVPAKIIKRNIQDEPVRNMDQCYDFILDYVI